MSYFVIEDFRLGLDRRKHILTLPAGAIYEGKNVNLTRGGDMESCKAFVGQYSLPGGQTFGLITAAGKLYTFGSVAAPSMPVGVLYQRLQHPSGTAMTELVHATVVKGKIFAIARFVGGLGVFFNGTIISDWLPSATVASYDDVATNFAAVINANPNFTASATGGVVTITGRANEAFTIAATAANGGAANNQIAVVSTTQAAGGVTSGTPASATVTFTDIQPDSVLSAIYVNSVDILGGGSWSVVDNDNAAAVAAAQINALTSSPDYTASAAGNVLTISAAASAGTTPNGYGIIAAVYPGTAIATDMAGGAAGSSGAPQISTVTFAGAFEADDDYSITLNGAVFLLSGSGASGQLPSMAITKNSKTYVIAGPNLFGSEIGDATHWNTGTGSFVTDMSNEVTGAEMLTALALFQGHMAVFSRSTIQIWSVDPDPELNQQLQVLQNIGTLAPKSVDAFGDSDVFFLSDTGLRSLKVRANTDSATLSDIGSPIDPLVIAAIKASPSNAVRAVSAVEPIDGRFLLQIGTTTYVFHFFPSAKVSGWTTYETGLAITDFAVLEQRLYARAGDTIYLLGGEGNDTYATQPFDVTLPFLSARQIATLKHFTGIDVVCEGEFDVYMATDPEDVTEAEVVATINKSTAGLGHIPMNGESEVVSLRFVGRASQYGRIANAVVHYEPLEAA